jgi:hypothetical protein
MSITAAIIVMCIMAAVAFALAYVRAMPAQDFRSIDQMNEEEAIRSNERRKTNKAWINSQWDVKP